MGVEMYQREPEAIGEFATNSGLAGASRPNNENALHLQVLHAGRRFTEAAAISHPSATMVT